jgi:phosphomannomutase/phosphomannomutase/phosphoglucomutase
MDSKSVIFREYDIRGVYKKDFDEKFAEDLARSYVVFLKERRGVENPTVTVGHDARHSGPSLAAALVKGFMESGAKVYTLGLVTTPISYFSTFHIDGVDGGIMVTGSHNPPEYNGFKVSVGKSTIFGEEIQELGRIYHRGEFITGSGSTEAYDIFPAYLDRYGQEFGKLEPVKVVLDGGNGAAGCIMRRLYERVGLTPEILFEKPDGDFPNHHPDPTIESNLTSLIAKVKETGAAVGIGFDGDADRIGVVDGDGNVIPGDELMVLFARDILKDLPGASIIGDVKCSDRLYEDIEKRGGNPIMWKTGHSLIKNKIKEEKAPFGGELSGHIFFADRNYGFDDAVYGSLRLVEILSKTKSSLSDMLSDLPSAFNTPEIRIDTTEEKKVTIVKALLEKYGQADGDLKINTIDGIRISYPNGWALARSSNTQPVLVLRFEADSKENLDNIQGEIEGFVKSLL